MRIALVHDWLTGMRGGERCLEVLCEMFPQADIFTMFYAPEKITKNIKRHKILTSNLNCLPRVTKYYRYLLPFYYFGINDLSKKLAKEHHRLNYDLVISISHCVAKNIYLPENLPHLCYCLTPMRYIWDQFDAYFVGRPIEPLMRMIRPRLQAWDIKAATNIKYFVAISEFIQARITNLYQQKATVVYPPVRTEWINPCRIDEPGIGFVCVNALVPYKNIDIIIEAFNTLGHPLTVIGQGPDKNRLQSMARKNIKFIDYLSDQQLGSYYRSAKALVFAAEEDFGMTPVEMQAAGRPVICLARGGAVETVSNVSTNATGVLFSELSANALISAVKYFIDHEHEFAVDRCIKQAEKFSEPTFRHSFMRVLESIGFEYEDVNLPIAHVVHGNY